jgi:opacity protein-like surface antigen
MKKLLLATTAFVMLAAVSANAADMGVRPAYAPPPAYNWTGGYWGGNIGYSWGTAKVDAAESTTVLGGTTVTATSQSQDINGVIGGVQGGYNYQSGVWVWGWETDIQASGQKGSSTFGTAAGAVPLTVTTAQWQSSGRCAHSIGRQQLQGCQGGMDGGRRHRSGLGRRLERQARISLYRSWQDRAHDFCRRHRRRCDAPRR